MPGLAREELAFGAFFQVMAVTVLPASSSVSSMV
jgi:hypothetical protein